MVEERRYLGKGGVFSMMPSAQRLACLLAFAWCGGAAQAIIPYGAGPSDVDSNLNVLAPDTLPPNGAPVANLVQFGVNNASGIYLGFGYVLTAHHVNMEDSGLVINGVSYDRDLTFAPLQITEENPSTAYADVVDMKLIKILPRVIAPLGLPSAPSVVQKLPLNYATGSDLSTSGTMAGWGQGKGAAITPANKGWLWGGDGTRALRWATNTTLSSVVNPNYSGYHYEGLETAFNRSLGSTTGQITMGDSGGGLFQLIGGTWKLSGLNTSILSWQASASTYDGSPPFFSTPQPSDSPDLTDYVRIARYGYLLRYENWANAKLADPAAVLTADPDKDGVTNLLEYAFHTDPNSAASASYPQSGKEGSDVTLTYTQLLSATDLSYVVEEASELTNSTVWTPAPVVEEIVSASGLTRVVKAKVAMGMATKKFLRLKVTQLQP
jgi:hypothetical protein